MSEGNGNGYTNSLSLFLEAAGYKAIRKLSDELKSGGIFVDGQFENTTLDKLGLEGDAPCRIGEMYLNSCHSGRIILLQTKLGDGSIEETVLYAGPEHNQQMRTEALNDDQIKRLTFTAAPGDTDQAALRYEQVAALYLGLEIPTSIHDIAAEEENFQDSAPTTEIQLLGPAKKPVIPVQMPGRTVYVSDQEQATAKEKRTLLSKEYATKTYVTFTNTLAKIEESYECKKPKTIPPRPLDETPLDQTFENAVAYPEGKQLIDEPIGDKGIVRKINLANVQNYTDPRKNEPYSKAFIDLAMTQKLVSAFDDLVRIEYDALVFVGGRSAFVLGNKEMFRPYIKAAETPLAKEGQMDLVRKLNESLKDEKLTPEQFKKISKSMLVKGQLYAAMDAMCGHNQDALLIYELDNADPKSVIKHMFSTKGNTAVSTLDDDLLIGIIEELCRNKRSDLPDRYRQMIDFENHSITRNGRTVHFVGESTKDKFLRYVTSDAFTNEQMCVDMMLWAEGAENWQEEELSKERLKEAQACEEESGNVVRLDDYRKTGEGKK